MDGVPYVRSARPLPHGTLCLRLFPWGAFVAVALLFNGLILGLAPRACLLEAVHTVGLFAPIASALLVARFCARTRPGTLVFVGLLLKITGVAISFCVMVSRGAAHVATCRAASPLVTGMFYASGAASVTVVAAIIGCCCCGLGGRGPCHRLRRPFPEAHTPGVQYLGDETHPGEAFVRLEDALL